MNNHKTKKGVIKSDRSIEVTSFEGIIPDVETLTRLEEIHPGTTKLWMELASEEIRNRHKNDERITWTFKYSSVLGLVLGFVSSILVTFVGFYCIYIGQAKWGAYIIIGATASVIAAFLLKKKNDN